MIKQVVLAIVVGVITAIFVALVGSALVEFGAEQIGNFLKSVATILGILAAVWYFFTHQNSAHI